MNTRQQPVILVEAIVCVCGGGRARSLVWHGTVSVYITACSGSSPWKPLTTCLRSSTFTNYTLSQSSHIYLPSLTPHTFPLSPLTPSLSPLTPSLSHPSHLPSHPSHLPSLTPHTFPLTPHTFPLSPLTPSLSPLTGVPIVHLITYPFPRVWHTARDNADAIDKTFVSNFRKILAVFLHEYFHLR